MARSRFSQFCFLPLAALAFVGCGASEARTEGGDEGAAALTGGTTGLRFGVAPQWYQSYAPPAEGPAGVDVVVVGDWLVENGFTDAHQRKIQQITRAGKVPYFFGYIATAMTKRGLGEYNDCDGNPSAKLCQEGAQYLRTHLDADILPAYRSAAARIGAAVGTGEALIHMEPDFYQFSERAQRNAFSRAESDGVMNRILGAIRQGCPTCKVVIDFSPWFSPERTAWARTAGDFYAGWDRTVVQYVGLTGKPFPFTEGKIDNFTYREISSELGLPLVVVDAYTFGGGPIDIDRTWLDAGNLAKAAAMGISHVILSQQGDVAGYDRFLASYRGSSARAPEPPPSRPSAPAPTPTPPSPATPAPPGSPAPAPSGDGPAVGGVRVSGGAADAYVAPSSTWAGGYCAEARVTGRDAQPVPWTVRVPKKGTLTQSWSSTVREDAGDWVFTGLDYNRTAAYGQTVSFGFCVTTS